MTESQTRISIGFVILAFIDHAALAALAFKPLAVIIFPDRQFASLLGRSPLPKNQYLMPSNLTGNLKLDSAQDR